MIMSLFNVFSISGSALAAETTRLNVTASNLANAESAGATPETTYRARLPVFQALMGEMDMDALPAGVRVSEILESPAPLQRDYRPEHPLADAEGYVSLPNVNAVEEMANMISAARAYQTNVEVITTSKDLLLRTLNLGQ
jgi:flagellar basal-body rod protein FlgC